MTFDDSWNRIHQSMEWGLPPELSFVQFFEDNFADRDHSDMHFVDLGCATGAQVVYLLEKGCRVTAIDASRAAIQRLAPRITRDQASRLTLLLGDFADLELPAECVDCVIDVSSLQHVPLNDAHAVIDRAKGWFKPGRGVVFSKAAPDEFDVRYLRSKYLRLANQDHVNRIFEGYVHCTRRVTDYMPNGDAVVHWVTVAVPASSQQQFNLRV